MTRLPRVSGGDVVKALERAGFREIHRKGSHRVLRRDSPFARTVVPDHKEINTGTLRNIIRQTGLTVAQFRALLDR